MEFRFTDKRIANGLALYPAKDEQELLFVITCLVLQKWKAEITIPPSLLTIEKVLKQLPFIEIKKGKLILYPERISAREKVIIDASTFPASVFALSIIFSATGTEADITGLETFSTGNDAGMITSLQRMLYRLNINTDFCGGSKFKVFNHKEMKAPAFCLTADSELFPVWMLIPVAIKTGMLRLTMNESILKKKTGLITAGGFEISL